MKRIILHITFFTALFAHGQQLYIDGDAQLYISPGANLEVTGDLVNNGTIFNVGTLSLYGNWDINNTFNGTAGELVFLGGQGQMVSPPSLLVNSLTLNQSGGISFLGDEFIVTDDITFDNGVVKTGDDTRFILQSNVSVIGGSTASYFQGRLSYQGSGIRKFPMGYDGVYAPITMLDVFGSNPELTVFFKAPNDSIPIPDDDVLGISGNGIWEVELSAGSMRGTPVQIDFSGEDLENFAISNRIRHKVKSPVVTVSDSPGGVYRSLGVAEDLTDSVAITEGTITTEIDFGPEELSTSYFAIGVAPRIDPRGLVYIPEIFSPAATDVKNRTFMVFGEKILRDNFSMQIYNRFGALVYSTESLDEGLFDTRTGIGKGWDGTNQRTGNQEPSGLYYYQVVLTRINGDIEERTGPFYLQR